MENKLPRAGTQRRAAHDHDLDSADRAYLRAGGRIEFQKHKDRTVTKSYKAGSNASVAQTAQAAELAIIRDQVRDPGAALVADVRKMTAAITEVLDRVQGRK